MFETTILQDDDPELMRASGYRRYLEETKEAPGKNHGDVLGTRLSGLSPSLQADLQRYEHQRPAAGALDMLEVLAACVRHASRVTIHFCCAGKVVPLTVFPMQHLLHCPLSLQDVCAMPLDTLQVMHVEPAMLLAPGESHLEMAGLPQRHSPLAPWLWALAWHGPRNALLPEIAGPAAYRVNPSLRWERWPMDDSLRLAVQRLSMDVVNLRELSEWPGLGRERAIRLLNAIYLQAGLIISRSHREAISDSWFGGLGRH